MLGLTIFVELSNFVLKLWFGDDRPSLSPSSRSAGEDVTEKTLLSNCKLKKSKGEYPQGHGQSPGMQAHTHILYFPSTYYTNEFVNYDYKVIIYKPVSLNFEMCVSI